MRPSAGLSEREGLLGGSGSPYVWQLGPAVIRPDSGPEPRSETMRVLRSLSAPGSAARLAVVGLALLLLTAGCSDLTRPGYRYAEVLVRVVTDDGEPIPDMQLVLYTGLRHMAHGTSDARGEYLFTHVPHGLHGVYVPSTLVHSARTAQAEHQYVEVEAGERYELEFRYILVTTP